jgi:IS6 family transposase
MSDLSGSLRLWLTDKSAKVVLEGVDNLVWGGRFGFAGAWTVREQNRLLGACFGFPQVNEV